ncbi:4Fe-4S dicluster domain-containing protein [Candidatus Bathyarchaeota archaeon]|nr:4Fe-4S dicluster domain-containing protein [Candidatus Bathyarchaeota archaeon]
MKEDLKTYSKSLGIDLVGVADIAQAKEYIIKQGGDHVGRFPRAVSLGVRLIDDVVDELVNHTDIVTISSYRGVYNTANQVLDRATFLVAKKIQQSGYRAYPVPASSMLNNGNLEAVFSHKVAANLAGLGWIGKNCLLVTPEFGPRLRLASVLTDAPLETGGSIPNRCGSCTRCTDICPSNAIKGVTFSPKDPRDVRLDASKCDDYTTARMEKYGNANCGLCVHICPFGKRDSDDMRTE